METEAAKAAKAIRSELKQKFPGISFRVLSKNYSGGNNISIRWEDGPMESDVNEVAGKYSMGHFDEMTDSYEYSNYRDGPQVKFVFTNRDMSEQTRRKIDQDVLDRFNVDLNDEKSCFAHFDAWPDNIRYRIFNKSLSL